MAKSRTKQQHDELIAAAKEAIDEVHSDTLVSPSQTLADLKDIRDHLDITIEALKSTISDGESGDGQSED
jgi:hypothetical protein